jgi:hypothetical protein
VLKYRKREIIMKYRESNENKGNAVMSGVVLVAASIILIFTINNFPPGGARNVASFVAGMFGFTAVQALRRSFDG